MTEPDAWALELWNRAADAADGCATQSFGDDAKAAALTIQRAFEERERGRINAAIETAKEAPPGLRLRVLVNCLRALATRQDAPVTENSHDH